MCQVAFPGILVRLAMSPPRHDVAHGSGKVHIMGHGLPRRAGVLALARSEDTDHGGQGIVGEKVPAGLHRLRPLRSMIQVPPRNPITKPTSMDDANIAVSASSIGYQSVTALPPSNDHQRPD